MAMKLFVLLILTVFSSDKIKNDAENGPEKNGNIEENSIVVKIEEDESVKVNKKSEYIGVCYHKILLKWRVQRWSAHENKIVYYGCYDDEKTAAHVSDTLAIKLMKNDELKLKLNFPDGHIEAHWKTKRNNKFIGVTYHKTSSKWKAQRWSRHENKYVSNGRYNEEETAAHASDTLAKKLMENGEQGHKLNFSDNDTEEYPKETNFINKFIGVSYEKSSSKWRAQRWSKNENTNVSNGNYDDKETAAHASDTLARKLMKNGEQNLKLNFPENHTEVYPVNQKRKRQKE